MMADAGLSFAIPIDQVRRFLDTAQGVLSEEIKEKENKKPKKSSSSSQQFLSPPPHPHMRQSLRWFGSDNETYKGDEGTSSDSVTVVESGKRRKRYVGLVMRSLTPELASKLISMGHLNGVGTQCSGVYVLGVLFGSPAER